MRAFFSSRRLQQLTVMSVLVGWSTDTFLAQDAPRTRSLGDTGAGIGCFAFSPDSKNLITAGGGKVRIWDLATGNDHLLRSDGGANCVSMSLERRAAFGEGSGPKNAVIRVWQYPQNEYGVVSKELLKLQGHMHKPTGLAFSTDGKWLASIAEFPDSKARIWDARSGEALLQIDFDQGEAWSVIFSPDPKVLVTGHFGWICLWSAETGKKLNQLKTAVVPVGSLSYSADGKLLAAAGGGNVIQMWDMPAGKERLRIDTEGANTVSLSPSGKLVAVASSDAVQVWSVATGKELLKLDGRRLVAFSPDGKSLAFAKGNEVVIRELSDLPASLREPPQPVDTPANPDPSIAQLIRGLGDAQFSTRATAAAKLLECGEPARNQLERAAREHDDLELRRRAQKIVDQLNERRRLASGVHVVGLYEASPQAHFRLMQPGGHDTNWPRFCAALVSHGQKDAPSPGKRLWELLPPKARAVAADKEMLERIEAQIKRVRRDDEAQQAMNQVLWAVEAALRRPDFYQERHFGGLTLDEEGKRLLKRHKELSLLESWVFNRRLLEASFAEVIKKSDFRLDKATVPVRVAATTQPITLIVCSYESVRWQIQADKGAKVEKVIVGGYYLQDVTGTDAPITYRVYDQPGSADFEPRFFWAYGEQEENYPKLVDALRRLTGKEIASFQGRYSYEGGPPFVVGDKK